jgi:hypothetical protein
VRIEGSLIAINTCLGFMALALFGAGCSQIVGFKNVTVVDPDAGVDSKPDAMEIDGPPPKLWVFVTSSSSTGGFAAGVREGPRKAADIRCEDEYVATFMRRGCTKANIHAVIQIDDTVDTVGRMAITFPIPRTSEVLRATDETLVALTWDALVDPNAALREKVSTDTSAVRFWSGVSGTQCSGWTSSTTGTGTAGDAKVVNQWMSAGGSANCNNFDHRLLCICW